MEWEPAGGPLGLSLAGRRPRALNTNKRSQGGLRKFGTRAKENMFRDLDLELDLASTQVPSGYGPCIFRK